MIIAEIAFQVNWILAVLGAFVIFPLISEPGIVALDRIRTDRARSLLGRPDSSFQVGYGIFLAGSRFKAKMAISRFRFIIITATPARLRGHRHIHIAAHAVDIEGPLQAVSASAESKISRMNSGMICAASAAANGT